MVCGSDLVSEGNVGGGIHTCIQALLCTYLPDGDTDSVARVRHETCSCTYLPDGDSVTRVRHET